MLVHKQTDQLGAGNRRVGVVQLDRDMVGQRFDLMPFRDEAAQDVLQRGRREEVFLLQAQLLTGLGGVVGIENAGNRAGQSLGDHGADKVTTVEAAKIEQNGRLGRPQTQGVGPTPLPTHDRRIIGAGDDLLGGVPLVVGPTAEANFIGHFRALKLPGVALRQPAFGDLDLASIFETLFKQPMFVADAIAIGRDAKGRQAI